MALFQWSIVKRHSTLFTGVRGIKILRTSPFGHSRKSNCRVLHRTRPDRPGIAAVGTPASGLFLMFDLAP